MSRLGGMSRRRRGRPLNAEVNIINLVDVMLVLLIIFMVTAPILQGGIVVRLPKASSKPVQMTDALTVTIDSHGVIAIGDLHQSWQQFQANFPVLAAAKHPNGVFIRGDAGARFGDVVRVLGVVKDAGIQKVGIVTEPTGP